MFSFGWISLPVFGDSEARTSIIRSVLWININEYYQQMCFAWLACCCQWPTVCLILTIEARQHVHKHTIRQTHTHTKKQTHTHKPSKPANPETRPVCSWLIGATSQNSQCHGQHPDSQLCMVSTLVSTLRQPGLCLDVTERRSEHPLKSVICAPHFLKKGASKYSLF